MKITVMDDEKYNRSQVLVDEIKDDIDIYDRIIDEELYKEEKLPEEIGNHVEEYGLNYKDSVELLNNLAEHIAYQVRVLNQELSRERGTVASQTYREYLEVSNKTWSIPGELEDLDPELFLSQEPFAEIATGNLNYDSDEESI